MSAALENYKPSDFKDIVYGKKLGAGTYGTVFVGLLKDGRWVAVKQLEVDEDASGKNTEIDVHSRLHNPHIIRYLHSEIDRTQSPPKLLVFLEFVTGGSLTSIMKTLPGCCLPISVVRVYSNHMFQGLAYLHENGVAHRDIKGENILVSQDTGSAKLADFDQAKVVGGSMTMRAAGVAGNAKTLAGTPFWIAPEVITQEDGYDPFKADVWSAGCTVAEMFTGRAPWLPMSTPMAIMYKLANTEGWPDAIPKDKAQLGDDLYDFLEKCFHRDAKTRPSARDLLQHPFLKL
jgi:serine/threonine protein kinase